MDVSRGKSELLEKKMFDGGTACSVCKRGSVVSVYESASCMYGWPLGGYMSLLLSSSSSSTPPIAVSDNG